MESFSWAPWFETGLPRVDEQHRGLVDIINRLGDLIVEPDTLDGATILGLFGDLAAYAGRHFREEEAQMSLAQVDARHCGAHRADHARFLEQLAHQRTAIDGSGSGFAVDLRDGARTLLHFMTDWLAYHILGCDQTMALQMAAIAAGTPAAQAYEQAHHRRDPATATLLLALDRLFRQVSDRNRELCALNRTLESRVAERTRELSESNQRLQDLALTDPLTGLANRRHAMRCLQEEWRSPASGQRPLACIMLDADRFKPVNDQYGHAVGDRALQEMARRLRTAVRTDDTVCRLGGDEFLVICANTPKAGALETAQRLRRAMMSEPLDLGVALWDCSISVGVAARGDGMPDVESLLRAADLELYSAKRKGHDGVAAAAAGTAQRATTAAPAAAPQAYDRWPHNVEARHEHSGSVRGSHRRPQRNRAVHTDLLRRPVRRRRRQAGQRLP